METAALSGIGQSAGSATSKSLQALTSDDLIKLLITQLTSQDPFEPVKNQDLLNQIGSIRNLEMNSDLSKTMKGLILQGQLGSAAGLIGKMVTGLSPSNELANGLVTGVRVTDGSVFLDLDTGQQVNVEKVTFINSAPVGAPAAG